MMTPEALPEHLKSISTADWSILFDLLETLRPEKAPLPPTGITYIKGKRRTRFETVPATVVNPAELAFLAAVNALDIAPVFEWMTSPESQLLRNNKHLDFDALDAVTLCKMITILVRADRFAEGYLSGCLEEGIVYRLLTALQGKVPGGRI